MEKHRNKRKRRKRGEKSFAAVGKRITLERTVIRVKFK